MVIGREDELGRVGPADERQREVDHLEQLHQQRHVLLAGAVVGEEGEGLVATARLLRLHRVLEDLGVDDVIVREARRAEPRALGHGGHGGHAALLVVVVAAVEPVAQQDLVAAHRLAAAAERAVRVHLPARERLLET